MLHSFVAVEVVLRIGLAVEHRTGSAVEHRTGLVVVHRIGLAAALRNDLAVVLHIDLVTALHTGQAARRHTDQEVVLRTALGEARRTDSVAAHRRRLVVLESPNLGPGAVVGRTLAVRPVVDIVFAVDTGYRAEAARIVVVAAIPPGVGALDNLVDNRPGSFVLGIRSSEEEDAAKD